MAFPTHDIPAKQEWPSGDGTFIYQKRTFHVSVGVPHTEYPVEGDALPGQEGDATDNWYVAGSPAIRAGDAGFVYVVVTYRQLILAS